MREITNCKVIPGDHVTPQHRLLTMDLKLERPKHKRDTPAKNIKWFKLKEGDKRQEFKEMVLHEYLKIKKEAKRRCQREQTEENRDAYKRANKQATKVVTQSKAEAYHKLNDELETKGGQKKIYRLSRSRHKTTKDFTKVKQIKKQGRQHIT